MRAEHPIGVSLVTLSLSSLIPSSSAFAQAQNQPERYYYGPHMMDWGAGWSGMILGPLMMLIVLGALVLLVALAVSWVGASWRNPSSSDVSAASFTSGQRPLEILKERFARGELDKAEYEERKHVLEG